MNGRWSTASHAAETEELEFRYRSLLAARRILDEQEETSPGNTRLQTQRLRRLRLYIQNSIAALESRMQQLGLTLPQSDVVDGTSGKFNEPSGAAALDH